MFVLEGGGDGFRGRREKAKLTVYFFFVLFSANYEITRRVRTARFGLRFLSVYPRSAVAVGRSGCYRRRGGVKKLKKKKTEQKEREKNRTDSNKFTVIIIIIIPIVINNDCDEPARARPHEPGTGRTSVMWDI